MTTAYQLSAEYRLLSVLMDAISDKALLFAQIPERLFTGNRVPIYQAIKDLHKANRPIDLVTVAKQLETNRHGNLIYELANTQDGITITSDWKTYAIDLNESWKARMMEELKEELAKDFDIGKAFEAFQMINAIDVAQPVSLAHPMAVDFLIQMNEVREGRRKDRTYPTYIRPLDRMMTGFKPTEFILLGGRPAMGKTLLGLQMALNQAMAGIPVVFFTLEMSSEQLMGRLIANIGDLEGEALLDPANRISTDKFFQLGVSADKLKGIPLHIVDLNQASTERIEAEISKMKIKNEVAGFYLDYLQLLEPVKSDKAKPKIEQMTNISKQLKAICKRQKVFGVVISSLSRATEARADHRPLMSDLRETGQLEFDADKIAFVYRPHEHNKDASPELMEVLIRKNRNGMLGKAEIKCELQYTRATEF